LKRELVIGFKQKNNETLHDFEIKVNGVKIEPFAKDHRPLEALDADARMIVYHIEPDIDSEFHIELTAKLAGA
jgi:hypothetical protein